MKNQSRANFWSKDDPSPSAKISKPPLRRRKKSWLHVNIGEREAKQMRALVQCFGLELRTFLELAIRHEVAGLGVLLNIRWWEAIKIPRAKRKAMARHYRQMCQAIGFGNTARN
jgi:hypothetical protein